MPNILFTAEQDQYLQLTQSRAYYKGLREGVKLYAHWRDGAEYVGTTGRRLSEALAEIDQMEQDVFKRFEIKE
ncbi:MAG: hypothetical protein EBT07_16490 [Actinobacteria bacterium]|nr:hypothetical protein [Actinomycetota bacterium]